MHEFSIITKCRDCGNEFNYIKKGRDRLILCNTCRMERKRKYSREFNRYNYHSIRESILSANICPICNSNFEYILRAYKCAVCNKISPNRTEECENCGSRSFYVAWSKRTYCPACSEKKRIEYLEKKELYSSVKKDYTEKLPVSSENGYISCPECGINFNFSYKMQYDKGNWLDSRHNVDKDLSPLCPICGLVINF